MGRKGRSRPGGQAVASGSGASRGDPREAGGRTEEALAGELLLTEVLGPGPVPRGAVPGAAARRALGEHALCASLEPSQRRLLVEAARLVRLAEGAALFREGDAADGLYLVLEGAVVPIAEGSPRLRLAVLGPGEWLGEIALATGEPRSATVEALVESALLAVEAGVVARIARAAPGLRRLLSGAARERLRDRWLTTSPLFAPMPRPERLHLAGQLPILEASPGALLVRQGRAPDGLFALLAGRADVVYSEGQGDRLLARLSAGDVFGELSLLRRAPAFASVVARRPSLVLALPRDTARQLLDWNRPFRTALSALGARREAENALRLASAPFLERERP